MYTQLWFLQLWLFCGLGAFLIASIRIHMQPPKIICYPPFTISTHGATANVLLFVIGIFGGPIVLLNMLYSIGRDCIKKVIKYVKRN